VFPLILVWPVDSALRRTSMLSLSLAIVCPRAVSCDVARLLTGITKTGACL
jgi:hypothetical protein